MIIVCGYFGFIRLACEVVTGFLVQSVASHVTCRLVVPNVFNLWPLKVKQWALATPILSPTNYICMLLMCFTKYVLKGAWLLPANMFTGKIKKMLSIMEVPHYCTAHKVKVWYGGGGWLDGEHTKRKTLTPEPKHMGRFRQQKLCLRSGNVILVIYWWRKYFLSSVSDIADFLLLNLLTKCCDCITIKHELCCSC